MADNTTLNTGSGGDTMRDVDRSGVKTAVVGLDIGIGTGTEKLMATGQATMANSIPVVVASNQNVLATAAKQPALGTAGVASADVLTVQGIGSMTPFLVALSGSNALASHQSTNVDQWNGNTTDTNSGAKSAGTLRVVLATDQPALSNKLLVTPDSVALPAHQSVNVDQLNGTTTDTNSGNKSAGTLRVVLATDQPALTNKLLVTPDSVALPANQSVNVNQLAGTTTDTNSGNKSAGTLRCVLATDQPQLTNALLVTPSPATSGGPSTSRIKAAGSTNATSVKGSAGQVYGWYLYNNASAARFFKLYNKATAPTVGTDTPFTTIGLPANGGCNIEFSMGIPMGTGIAYAITTGVADSDTGACTADDVHGILLYK